MKTCLTITFIFLASATFAQQKQERKVDVFDKIKLESAIIAYIRQGDKPSVTIETDAKDLDKIITEVRGTELLIRREQNWNWNRGEQDKVVAYITVKDLKGLDISGASSVKGETPFKSGDFDLESSGASRIEINLTVKNMKINLSGASNVDLQLNADEMEAELSGASRLRISGKTDRQEVQASGASRYQAYELTSKRTRFDGSGASNGELSVSEEIRADLSGASSLRYKGSPTRAETHATGGSSVRKQSE
jgi:hypothetical protein